MRATTESMPKVSLATRAAMMLELSPELTAAKASARSMPALPSTFRSKPIPVTLMPLNCGPRRRKASGSESITLTVWFRSSSERASVEPTRPQPMITTCTVGTLLHRERRRCPEMTADALPLSLVGVGGISKRIILGRKLRSSQLGETLLPKRIALPVFASDALSSVAYAPDEIFLTLALAGVAAFTASAWIGLAVAFVMLIVVASYRQNVHAYPSGGGDYEVATVNLGVRAGLTVASALLVDYVLTVAVSVSSGAQYAAAAIPWLRGHEALFAVLVVAILMTLNLRGCASRGRSSPS